jgi:hypothetical protein
VIEPIGFTPDLLPIFQRPLGYLFSIVVEGRPGPSFRPVADSTFNWNAGDPSLRPGMEMIVSRQLGDGSAEVCDNTFPLIGGIPASTGFDDSQANANAVNDLGCRFLDGTGLPRGRSRLEACTFFPNGEFHFVNPASTIQYCGVIAEPYGFPVGDTRVDVRLRDLSGVPGPVASFIVRVTGP